MPARSSVVVLLLRCYTTGSPSVRQSARSTQTSTSKVLNIARVGGANKSGASTAPPSSLVLLLIKLRTLEQSSDGFSRHPGKSYAIQEVTVTTATPGALQNGGEGRFRFVITKSGSPRLSLLSVSGRNTLESVRMSQCGRCPSPSRNGARVGGYVPFGMKN